MQVVSVREVVHLATVSLAEEMLVSRTAFRRLIGSAAVATLAAGGAVAMSATGASAATMPGSAAATTVSAQCQTDMSDLVGLAMNMQVNVQDNDINELGLNSQASLEFNSSVDCSSFVSQADDNNLFTATVDLPAANGEIANGASTDVAQGIQRLQQAITLTEGVQSDLGLPVGGSVPQATPPNPDIPQACMTALDVWAGDVNNMLTADENKDVPTMQNNLTAVEEFSAPADCAPVTTSDQQTQLTTALNDMKTAVQLATTTTTGKGKNTVTTGGDFTDAATDLSNAKTIIFNTETAIGFFVGI